MRKLRARSMAYPRIGGNVNGVVTTTVDCQKQVRSWRLLRSLLELIIPTCNSTLIEDKDTSDLHNQDTQKENYSNYEHPSIISNSITFTGTIFRYRGGKVSFCIEANSSSSSSSTNPILVLELAVPTSVLAKEMRGGTLRMVLESSGPSPNCAAGSCSSHLLSTPLWSMYCNGREVGYAVKRRPSNADLEALRLMSSVVVGAGVIGIDQIQAGYGEDQQQLMYLRAKFQRVRGSSNSESFHLIDPEGTIAQELSIFFCRSTSA